MWLRALQIYDWGYSELSNGKVQLPTVGQNWKQKGCQSDDIYKQLFASQRNTDSLRQLMLLNDLCSSGLSPNIAELPKVWFTASYMRNWQQQLWQMTLISYCHFIHTALGFGKRWGSLGLLKWKTASEVEENAIWGRMLSPEPFVYLLALCLQA